MHFLSGGSCLTISIMMYREKRAQSRTDLGGHVLLNLQGTDTVMRGRLYNQCPNGLGLMVDHPLPVRSYVYCREVLGRVDRNARGSASVRFCVWSKGGYQVGLEHTGAKKSGRFT